MQRQGIEAVWRGLKMEPGFLVFSEFYCTSCYVSPP